MDFLKWVQWRAWKVTVGLENLYYKERPWELELFSLGKEKLPIGMEEHREEGISGRMRWASKKRKIHVLCENLLIKPNPRESDLCMWTAHSEHILEWRRNITNRNSWDYYVTTWKMRSQSTQQWGIVLSTAGTACSQNTLWWKTWKCMLKAECFIAPVLWMGVENPNDFP